MSEFVRQRVEVHIGVQKPSIIIPHGVIVYGDNKTKIEVLPKRYNLLMIGRINYYKGVDLLADALPLIDYDDEMSPKIKMSDIHDKRMYLYFKI